MSVTPSGPGLVLIRCDIGAGVGVGHVMRTLALAEEFAARGHEVRYAADLDSVPFAAEQVRARGFGHVTPPTDVADHVRLVRELGPQVVVIDSYRLPEEVYAAVRELVPTLALVDGDPTGRPAHLILEGNIGAEADEWPLPDGSRRLAGLHYALLRSDVLALRPATPEHVEADPLRVLAFFGGTDAFGAAPVVARALAATGEPFDLTVVAADDARRAELESLEFASGQHLEVIEPTSRIAELVRNSDVVLSAAGSSSWELLCLGAACALVCVADNQHASYERVAGSGAVLGLGMLSDLRARPDSRTDDLRRLLRDTKYRANLRASAWAMVDGHGRDRVVDVVAELLRARGHHPR